MWALGDRSETWNQNGNIGIQIYLIWNKFTFFFGFMINLYAWDGPDPS
jgi:hypothetical protein